MATEVMSTPSSTIVTDTTASASAAAGVASNPSISSPKAATVAPSLPAPIITSHIPTPNGISSPLASPVPGSGGSDMSSSSMSISSSMSDSQLADHHHHRAALSPTTAYMSSHHHHQYHHEHSSSSVPVTPILPAMNGHNGSGIMEPDMPDIARALAEIEIIEERRRALSHASDHSSQSPITEGMTTDGSLVRMEGEVALQKSITSISTSMDHTEESLRELRDLVTRITDGGTSIAGEIKTLAVTQSMVQSELKEMKSMMANIQTGGTKVYDELKHNGKMVEALYSCSEKVLTTLTKRVDRDEERRHHREQRRQLRLEERERNRSETTRRELAHQEEEAKTREVLRQERHERKAFAAQLKAHTAQQAAQHAEIQTTARKQMWIMSSAFATSAFLLGWFIKSSTGAPSGRDK